MYLPESPAGPVFLVLVPALLSPDCWTARRLDLKTYREPLRSVDSARPSKEQLRLPKALYLFLSPRQCLSQGSLVC